MKTYFSIVLTALCLLASTNTFAQNYQLQAKDSQIEWTGKAAFNAYSLSGNISAKSGKITLASKEITSLEVSINMKSIEYTDKKLKNHLKGADFFEVKTYPIAVFKLTEAVTIANGKALLIGKMTIKDITKKEQIPVTISRTQNGLSLGFSKALDRTAYGVEYNSPSIFEKLKADAIADEFILKAQLNFEK